MFTGIITACEPIVAIQENNGNLILSIHKPTDWQLEEGESISIDGVCSTVIQHTPELFSVEYMPETLRITTLNQKRGGDRVNVERSLRISDLLSGHLVYGHVDTKGTIDQIVDDAQSHVITVLHDAQYDRYLIQKGSVTINGVSLTVIQPTEGRFSVSLVSHTWAHTTYQFLRDGDEVNIEYDVIAKYIEKLTRRS